MDDGVALSPEGVPRLEMPLVTGGDELGVARVDLCGLSQANASATRCPPLGGAHPGSNERIVSIVSNARRRPPGNVASTWGCVSPSAGRSTPSWR